MPVRRNKKIFSKKHDYRNASVGPSLRFDGGSSRRPSSRSSRSAGSFGAGDLDFNRPRSSRRVQRGEISHVIPNTRSRESMSSYNRRAARRGLTGDVERNSKLKTILLGAFVLVFAAVVASFVGSCTFTNTINSKLALQDKNVAKALVAPEEDKPYYVLLAGVYQDGNRNHGADMLMLARIDESEKNITFINVPGNMVVNGKRVGTIERISGDRALIEQVSDAVNLDIAHYVRIDSANLVKLVDSFGGINMVLPEEVDDPDTGDTYIPAGEQRLDGKTALIYLRANNYAGGNETRAANQVAFLKLILAEILAGDPKGMLDNFANCIQTDYNSDQVLDLIGKFSDTNIAQFITCSVPGYYTMENKVNTFYMNTGAWETMLGKIEEGKDPNAKESVLHDVKTSNYKVEIRNGSGIFGAAKEAKGILKENKFKIGKVGNTETNAYNETLIIYKKDKNAKAAQAVCEALGVGRVVQNSLYYKFKTDVLVIIGRDWRLDANS